MAKKLISIVIPSYNEEGNVKAVYDEITKNTANLGYDLEIIFVNDGSQDKTWKEISQLSNDDKKVKGINLSRNFGHACALEAGLNNAKGDAVIMMDGDLQHPASTIPLLIAKWEEGYQIVNTIRKSTEGVSFFKKITSRFFYKVLNSLSSLKLEDGEADFRLLDKEVVKVINRLPESPKFYRGIVNWIGFKSTKIGYKASARIAGKSSYSLKKMIELARVGFTSFSMKPLKIIISFGLMLSIISFISLCIMIYLKIFVDFQYISNNVVLATVILFVTGILSVFQGIIAIYLIDIFYSTKGRPTYIVEDALNIKNIDE